MTHERNTQIISELYYFSNICYKRLLLPGWMPNAYLSIYSICQHEPRSPLLFPPLGGNIRAPKARSLEREGKRQASVGEAGAPPLIYHGEALISMRIAFLG